MERRKQERKEKSTEIMKKNRNKKDLKNCFFILISFFLLKWVFILMEKLIFFLFLYFPSLLIASLKFIWVLGESKTTHTLSWWFLINPNSSETRASSEVPGRGGGERLARQGSSTIKQLPAAPVDSDQPKE